MHSLRTRLFVLLGVLAVLAALAVGGATYVSVRAEADELFDYHLRQMALSLRDQGRIAEDERAALVNPELDYVVQVWSLEGVSLYSSRPAGQALTLPPRAVLGFSEASIDGRAWRVFAAATPLRVVQVGQPLSVRRGLAAAAAGRSVLPIAAAAPLVGLALWWLVGRSLAPLQRVVDAARRRDAGATEPLPSEGLPSELLPLVEAFNALLARLAAAFDTQRAFVADAAHELRTPLTALKLQLSLLNDPDDPASASPQRTEAVARLRAGIDRATHLVGQLMALARAEPGRPVIHEALDLAALVRDAAADARPRALALGARLHVDAPPELPWQGDADALRSLVRNLVDNAVLHGGKRPTVDVRLALEGGAPRLTVDDDGPGIPSAERERVFDRFHRRGDGTEGSGLGLAIVRAVAARHGAQVTLGDAPAGGLRVDVRWPTPASRTTPAR